MGDFATEIICCQQNSVMYPIMGLDVHSVTSFDSAISTGDSGSEQWSTPKALSPDEGVLVGVNDYKWCEVKLDRKHLFKEKEHVFNGVIESEYKYYTPRRVSSLKTSRTPPGTPKSKAVRFADALGLDLEDVHHVFNQDLPPKIPASAVQDLILDQESKVPEICLRLESNFSQPGTASDFLRRVKMHNVALENAFIEQNNLSGTIRLLSLTFEKKVMVRVTFNEWINNIDFPTCYVPLSHDGVTDRFSFSISFPPSCYTYGHRIQFAVVYECSNGVQHWDNNFGQNYVYSCLCESQQSLNYL